MTIDLEALRAHAQAVNDQHTLAILDGIPHLCTACTIRAESLTDPHTIPIRGVPTPRRAAGVPRRSVAGAGDLMGGV